MTLSSRWHQLTQFLQTHLPKQTFHVDTLPGDASLRRYHRITLARSSRASVCSYLLMDASAERESVAEFVQVANLLQQVVNVPDVIAKDIDQGFLLLQDFGHVEFAHLIEQARSQQDTQQINELYHWAIDSLLDLQRLPIDEAAFLPHYDTPRLNTEMALFTQWFLPYVDVSLSTQAHKCWQQLTATICMQVTKQPQVVVHRDYHSRNLMQDQHQTQRLGIIDFQDAVIGPYTYDVVSLLRDAYVSWPKEQTDVWLSYYHHNWQANMQADKKDQHTFMQDAMLMSVQRHLKVLGIFVRLAQRDGKARYLNDIPNVWQDLMSALAWLNHTADESIQTEVQPFYNWLISTVKPKVNQICTS